MELPDVDALQVSETYNVKIRQLHQAARFSLGENKNQLLQKKRNMEKSTESLSFEGRRTKVGNARRSSMPYTTSSPANSEEKNLPNYIRTATGSCHDFCKYGIKHESDSKGKQPLPLPPSEVSNTRKQEDVKQSSMGSPRVMSSPQLKIKSPLKRKSGFNPKQLVKSSPPDGQEGSEKVIDLDKKLTAMDAPKFLENKAVTFSSSSRLSARSYGNASSRSHNYSSKTQAASKPGQKTVSSLKTKVRQKDPVAKPPISKVSGDSSGIVSAGTTFKDIGLLEVKEITEVVLQTNSLSPPAQDHEFSIVKKVASSSRKVGTPFKSMLASKEKLTKTRLSCISGNSGGRLPARNISKYSLTTTVKRAVKSSTSSALNSHAPRITNLGLRNSRNKRMSNASWSSPLANGEPSLKSIKLKDLSVRKMRSSISSSIDHPDIELPNVKTHAASHQKNPSYTSSSSAPSSRLSLSSSASASRSSPPMTPPSPSFQNHQRSLRTKSRRRGQGETKTENQVKVLGHDRRKTGRSSSSESEGKERGPQKSKSRRGMIVNVQAENSGLMRLKFRQRKLVRDQDGSGEAGKRSSRRRNTGADDPDKPTAPAVVLRHQDVQSKKDTQDLNQVIEETASKLVESRKSKVKALVGAFESVISLRDSKPIITC